MARATGVLQNPPAAATFARTTKSGQWDSSPAGYKVYNVTNQGSTSTDLQLWTYNLSITSGNYYLLTFRAKCTLSFTLPGIMLQENGSPYTSYAVSTSATPTITTSWATYTVLFLANTTATNVRLDFYLGGAIPVGSTFYLDTLSLKTCVPTGTQRLPSCDIGNIIFNNGESCGVKRWCLTDQALPELVQFRLGQPGRLLLRREQLDREGLFHQQSCDLLHQRRTGPDNHRG